MKTIYEVGAGNYIEIETDLGAIQLCVNKDSIYNENNLV